MTLELWLIEYPVYLAILATLGTSLANSKPEKNTYDRHGDPEEEGILDSVRAMGINLPSNPMHRLKTEARRFEIEVLSRNGRWWLAASRETRKRIERAWMESGL